jgi:hypothetical protein
MTNREAHEEAAGMGLDGLFFELNKIDPNAECIEDCAAEHSGSGRTANNTARPPFQG